MDYVLPHLLSAEEIVHKLKERQLNIPQIENMQKDELDEIYNKFVQPLSRREESCLSINKIMIAGNHTDPSQIKKFNNSQKSNNTSLMQQGRQKRIFPSTTSDNDCATKLAKLALKVSVNGRLENYNGKRPEDEAKFVTLEVPASKRKKITWP